MRRSFVSSLALATSLLVVGCGPSREDDLTREVGELQDRLDRAKSAVDDLDLAISTLEGAVGDAQSAVADFSSENWREVVPTLASSVDDIESLLSDVRLKAEDVEAELSN